MRITPVRDALRIRTRRVRRRYADRAGHIAMWPAPEEKGTRMLRLTRIATLVVLPALLSFAFIACGDDDDDGGAITRDNGSSSTDNNSGSGNTDTGSSNNDDDKDKDDGKSDPIRPSGNTGSDEAYVSAICKGFSDYFDDLSSMLSGIDFTDPNYEEKLNEKMTDPMRAVAKVFANANPPKDLEDWHKQVVAAFNQTVQALEKGDYDALEDESLEFPDMPADVEARLEKVAENNKDCQALSDEGEGVFGNLGGN